MQTKQPSTLISSPAINSALLVGSLFRSTSLLRYFGGGQLSSEVTAGSAKELGPTLAFSNVKARAAFISKVLFSSISLAVTWITSSPLD